MRWSRKRTVVAGLAGALVAAVATVVALNFVTGESQIERRLEHRYGIADPQFRRELGVLLGPPIIDGNQVINLENGVEIFPAMLAAVRAARHNINFETYIYWSGEIGREFAEALAERALAGVQVQVLIDWVGSQKMDQALLDRMVQAGVTVERYHPLHWYNLARMNNRTHRKLLIVDGEVGFTGGVGIADLWQGDANDPSHWRDSHYRLQGPAVAQMQAAFMDNWIKATGTLLQGKEYFPELPVAGTASAQVFTSSPTGGGDSMLMMYLLSLTAAEHTIDLAASYFVPDELDARGADRGAQAWSARAHHRAGRAHRHGGGAQGFACAVGRTARGRRGDPRVSTDHVPLQDARSGPFDGLGGLDQFRQSLVPAQRRGKPERLRP